MSYTFPLYYDPFEVFLRSSLWDKLRRRFQLVVAETQNYVKQFLAKSNMIYGQCGLNLTNICTHNTIAARQKRTILSTLVFETIVAKSGKLFARNYILTFELGISSQDAISPNSLMLSSLSTIFTRMQKKKHKQPKHGIYPQPPQLNRWFCF